MKEDSKEYRVDNDGYLLFAKDPQNYADKDLEYFEREPFVYLAEKVIDPNV